MIAWSFAVPARSDPKEKDFELSVGSQVQGFLKQLQYLAVSATPKIAWPQIHPLSFQWTCPV